MKPHTVNQISINSETPAQRLSRLEVDAMRLHLRDYQRAGETVPDAVRERAREMGIEVEA